MEPNQNESLFFNFSKSLCNFKNNNKTAKSGKCHRPGPLMRNPYLNFLREFRKRNCGLTVIEIVQRGAKEWNAMQKDKKLRYIEEAFYAPKLRRVGCETQLVSKSHTQCIPKRKRKVSICRTKKRRSRSTSIRRASRKKSKSSICSPKRRRSKRIVSRNGSSVCSPKRQASRRSSRKKTLQVCIPKKRSRKHAKKFKKSKCGQRKKLRKRRPKFSKSNCIRKAKKIKRVKRKRSICDAC